MSGIIAEIRRGRHGQEEEKTAPNGEASATAVANDMLPTLAHHIDFRKSPIQAEENKTPEIPKELLQYLSNAKRHHYVPEFLLQRFSTNPADEHPPIYRLDVKTGAISKLSTINCAVIQHYNRLSAVSGLPVGFAEAMLSYIEGQAHTLSSFLLA
jgi:hypothetical protein